MLSVECRWFCKTFNNRRSTINERAVQDAQRGVAGLGWKPNAEQIPVKE